MKIKINRNLVDKTRVEKREYVNKEGVKVVEESYEFEAVELRPEQQKVIASGTDWQLVKTHFVTHARTKDERANKVKLPIIGEVTEFKSAPQQRATVAELAQAAKVSAQHADTIEYPTQEINPEDIPF